MRDLDVIRSLSRDGVLGEENVPEPEYWHWGVLQPEELPERFQEGYELYGEIRFYW